MTVEQAKNLMTDNRQVAIDAVSTLIFNKIEYKAKKGWARLEISEELPDIFKEYDMPIISEVYGVLRENGFRINVMTHVVIWG